MSLRYLVTTAIKARGCGRLSDIKGPLIAHGFTEKQIRMALHNAKAVGYLWCDRKKRGEDPVYWPGKKKVPVSPDEKRRASMPPLVNSVFSLGSPRDWPKGWIGQVHRPLGEWKSTEEIV